MTLHATDLGRASALPLARAYLAQGGRLIIDDRGKLEPVGSFAWITADDPKAARRSFVTCRRFCRRLRDRRFASTVKALVVQQGRKTANGWLELRQEGSS